MVGRAPKKRRMKANDRISRLQGSRVPHSTTLPQSGPESGSSQQPLVSVARTEHQPTAVTTTMGDGSIFTMGEFTAVAADTEINSYMQNLLSNYPADLPLVSPGATDPIWLGTENLFPDLPLDIPGISTSEGMSDKCTLEFPIQERKAHAVRSRLAEQTDARAPITPSYRENSAMSSHMHASALMETIECLEEQLQNPQAPIDQAMQLNRHAMAKVREVSKTDEFRRCHSCPLLVATIMDLVVGLYEIVILSTERPAVDENNPLWQNSLFQQPAEMSETPSSGSSPRSAISGGSEAPLFQFGCLEFDPEEQEIFRAAMMRRDLRRCVETIQYCSQEILQQQTQAADLRRRPSNKIHTQWYQEMGSRTKELLAALPAQCSRHR
ncbi:hypothetical protein N7516_010901 [Penicillium verrucosum]|uniref:uncharacterized protein n=1 Tax=Penicillium verrucosum TaxID=60171 RepID=UPI0025450337|nr:uncharacterized protein N7516_010901 [Penicillium verrucosum]KAJ5920043.1 hypothetical protein N7516_010901 [Penicillium verrucosum]